MNCKRHWRKWQWRILSFCLEICTDGLTDVTETFSKVSQCPGKRSKQVLPQYTSEALHLERTSSEKRNLETGWVYPNEFSFPFSWLTESLGQRVKSVWCDYNSSGGQTGWQGTSFAEDEVHGAERHTEKWSHQMQVALVRCLKYLNQYVDVCKNYRYS